MKKRRGNNKETCHLKQLASSTKINHACNQANRYAIKTTYQYWAIKTTKLFKIHTSTGASRMPLGSQWLCLYSMHANYVLFIYPYLNDSPRSKLFVHKCTSIGSNNRVTNQVQSQVTTVTRTRSIVHYDGVVDAVVQWITTECWSNTHQQSGTLNTTHCSLGETETPP